MKKIVYKYRVSKFKPFMSGLLFAIISVIALILCLTGISDQTAAQAEIILPFGIALVSMLMGFISMFRSKEAPKQKI
jgi:uncharacterized membrane protein YtjA (UPF0391 family)